MSDALARPYDPFQITPRFVWVECPLADYPGFSVKVRSNLRNRDRKALMDLIADVDAERKRLADAATKRLKAIGEKAELGEDVVELIDEMNRLQDDNAARIPTAIAPHVVGWNLQERDTETGDVVDLPPPSEIGIEAFENVEQPMLDWIVGTLITAFRGGKSLTDSSKTRGESGEPPSASSETMSIEPEPGTDPASSPPSPASSPTPSASTSAA